MVVEKRKIAAVASLVIFVLYVTSYWMVRESHTVRFEREGCPISGCEEVYFPGDGLFIIYGPIYQLDKLTTPDADFVVMRTN